jgi:rhamnosyl/mannosyltransferase
LKILHIGKYFSPFSGGLENYMRDAMVALARRGIESTALVHRHSFSLKTRNTTFNADGQDFNIVRTGLWARLLFTPISPDFPWQLRRIIRTFKPDILHLHLPNPSAFWVLALSAAKCIPWVVHWHADVITSAQDWRMKLFYRFYQPFERAVLKQASAIIATSSAYRDASRPLSEWLLKCEIVPLGVDIMRFSTPVAANEPPAQRDSRLQVLAVGRHTYYKGFAYLIEAVAQAPDIHLNLVGQGDETEHLKTLVTSLNLQDRVTFHDFLSDADVAQQMSDCDCLCLPSIERTEAFGMVLLEAMYFGKATIVSNVDGSGMGWVVDDGITGIKVKPADANALAGALKRLAANREELVSMGQRGKEKFEQQFDINHAIEGLVTIYQQSIGDSPSENNSSRS